MNKRGKIESTDILVAAQMGELGSTIDVDKTRVVQVGVEHSFAPYVSCERSFAGLLYTFQYTTKHVI